jgi:putative transposase
VHVGQDREAARRVLAREIALFRFGLIHDALDPGLTAKQRGRLVRAVAAVEHPGPFGAAVRVSRANLDRWLRAYRTGGFTALVPVPRRVTATTPAQVLELAVALKKEAPGRTAAQVAAVLAAQCGWAPSERTLQRHFADLGFSRTRADGSPPATFGRFEAERSNARWVGDAAHGPVVAGRKAILVAFLDDHSRAVVAARWGYAENAVALRETLQAGLASRGRPAQIYVDNGAMFIDSALRRTCAVIGAKLTHSQPGRPQGRGKIERFFRTVRDQFLVEITDSLTGTGTPVASLAELNSLFTAWVEQVYHQRVHTETGQAPLQRFLAAGAPTPIPADLLAEALRWGEWRTVTSTAQVNLYGNLYDVDPALAGTRVELVFNPFDLADIDVRAHSRSYGKATPSRIRRHVHPKAATDTPPPPAPTGIDYLRLIETRHTHSLSTRLQYAHLADPGPATTPDNTTPERTTPEPGDATGDPRTPPAPEATKPPPDADGHHYDTDLVALTHNATPQPEPATPTPTDTGPATHPQPPGPASTGNDTDRQVTP